MECPNCREIENGEWRYYVSHSRGLELDLSEDEMNYEDSPIEFHDMVQSLPRMIIMDENGKQARVSQTGAPSSRSTTREVNALKEEVTTLKGQLVAQGEQMRAQGKQMSIIVHALQMFSLQIPMPAPDLAPPSTSAHFAQSIPSSLMYQT